MRNPERISPTQKFFLFENFILLANSLYLIAIIEILRILETIDRMDRKLSIISFSHHPNDVVESCPSEHQFRVSFSFSAHCVTLKSCATYILRISGKKDYCVGFIGYTLHFECRCTFVRKSYRPNQFDEISTSHQVEASCHDMAWPGLAWLGIIVCKCYGMFLVIVVTTKLFPPLH